jgi:hypothetical protein
MVGGDTSLGGGVFRIVPEDDDFLAVLDTSVPESTAEGAPAEDAPDDDTSERVEDFLGPGAGATGGQSVTNEIGNFTFVVPQGYVVALNTDIDGAGAAIMATEESVQDIDSATSSGIIIAVGDRESALAQLDIDAEDVGDASAQEIVEQLAAQEDTDVEQVGEVEPVEVNGLAGSAVQVRADDPEEGPQEGILAIVDVDAERLMVVAVVAPEGQFDRAVFDELLTTIVVNPAEGAPAADAPAEDAPAEDAPAEDAPADAGGGALGELDADGQVTVNTFPLPDDATGTQVIFSGGGGTVNYTTSMNAEEVAEFYRQALTPDGAVEREILTQITDGVLNLVFDGWTYANGRAVVIQTVPLGADTMNVNVRFEDI